MFSDYRNIAIFPNDAIYCFRDISRYKTLTLAQGVNGNAQAIFDGGPCFTMGKWSKIGKKSIRLRLIRLRLKTRETSYVYFSNVPGNSFSMLLRKILVLYTTSVISTASSCMCHKVPVQTPWTKAQLVGFRLLHRDIATFEWISSVGVWNRGFTRHFLWPRICMSKRTKKRVFATKTRSCDISTHLFMEKKLRIIPSTPNFATKQCIHRVASGVSNIIDHPHKTANYRPIFIFLNCSRLSCKILC